MPLLGRSIIQHSSNNLPPVMQRKGMESCCLSGFVLLLVCILLGRLNLDYKSNLQIVAKHI